MAAIENSRGWRRSTHCEAGACVEVSTSGDQVLVRRSDEPDGPELRVSRASWREFLAGLRAGEFDVPAID
ncbi:MAG TPA: DUF397 domain-containing protein [Rugosimonospora sp.]|nr:DUF397 domain-containing protein [Rugosimonospora sp.]